MIRLVSTSIVLLLFVSIGFGQTASSPSPDYIENGNRQSVAGDIDAAINSYTKAIQLGQNIARAYLLRGMAYNMKREQDKALKDFTSAISLDPTLIRAYFLRADIEQAKKELNGALADIERILAFAPNDQGALIRHAELKRLTGDEAGALADLQRAVDVDSKTELGRCAAVAIRVIRGNIRTDEVVDDLNALIANGFKDVPEAYFYRATVHLRLGHLDEAFADFSKTLELDPHNAFAWMDRGNVRQAKSDNQAAIEDYTRAIETNPELAWAWGNRGITRLLMGDTVNAQKDFDKCLEIDASLRPPLEAKIKLAKQKLGIKDKPD